MTELEEKYLLYEQPVNPNTVHQISHVHDLHTAQQHIQTLHSIQPSPSGTLHLQIHSFPCLTMMTRLHYIRLTSSNIFGFVLFSILH